MTISQLIYDLKRLERLDPPPKIANAEKRDEVQTARRFLRKRRGQAGPELERLRKRLLAVRLGIPKKAFSANPGFYAFAARSFLNRYLLFYGDELQLDEENKVSIKKDGEYIPWEAVPEEILQFPGNRPSQPWKYGPNGLQNKDMYRWEKMQVIKTENRPSWGARYILEICVCCEETPRFLGDHSWRNLKTRKGKIYSAGIYRDNNAKRNLKVKEGDLQSPDYSEFCDCNIHRLEVAVTKTAFKAIKLSIEEKKKQCQQFHEVRCNCTQNVNEDCKIAGFSLPTAKRGWRFLLHRRIVKAVDRLQPYLPQAVITVCDYVAGFFANLVQLGLKAPFENWRLLFNPENTDVHHPHTLGYEIFPLIEGWRYEEIGKLKKREKEMTGEELDEQIKEISYSLPPQFKTS